MRFLDAREWEPCRRSASQAIGSPRAGRSSARPGGRTRVTRSRRRSLDGETPGAFEGLSWAAWWLDDAETVFAARERAYRLYRERGDRGRRGPDGDVARRRRARLPRRGGGRERLAAAGAPAARPARGRSRPRLARLPRGLRLAPAGRHRAGARARDVRGRPGAALRRPRPGDARPRARGRRARRLRAGRGGDAAPGRGDAGGAGGRRDDPDLERLGLVLPRQRVHGRARLRPRVRVVRPDRDVRRPLRKPLHARVLPGRVRRRRPLARPLERCGADAGGVARGLRRVTPGLGRSAARPARRAEAAARARPTRRVRCSTGPGRRAAPSSAAGAWRSTTGMHSRPRTSPSGSSANSPPPGHSTASRRSSSSSMPGSRTATSARRRSRSRRCGTSRGSSAPSRSVRSPTGPRACSRPRRASTTGHAPCSRTRSTGSNEPAPRTRRPGRGSSWRRASSRWGGATQPGVRRRPPRRRSQRWARRRTRPGLDTSSRAATGSRSSRGGSARSSASSRRGSRTGRSPRGWS